MIDYGILGVVIGAILGVGGIAFAKDKGTRKTMGWIGGIFLVVGLLSVFGVYNLNTALGGTGGTTLAIAGGVGTSGTGGQQISAGTGYQPTVDYAVTDKFASTPITGTSYYKVNSAFAKTTAVTNVNIGDQITYWLDNSTTSDYYWVLPSQQTMGAGVNHITTSAFRNGTATVTLYDTVNRQSTTSGTYNTSMGANKQANIEVTYQGTAKKSATPFGGVMVVEYNSTISSVTCSGDSLLSTNPFHVTWTPFNLSVTYAQFGYGAGLDDGTGSVKKITCQFQNGGTGLSAGTPVHFSFVPANYYVSQAGNIVLDAEKFSDGLNTRLGSTLSMPIANMFFSA